MNDCTERATTKVNPQNKRRCKRKRWMLP